MVLPVRGRAVAGAMGGLAVLGMILAVMAIENVPGSEAAVLQAAGAPAGTATAGAPARTEPAAGPARAHVVTLITGERVVVSRPDGKHVAAALEAPTGGGRQRSFRALATPTAEYVVPDEALPYLGRQLDLSLFDLAEPASAVTVEWAAGARRHAIPGLAPTTSAPVTPRASATPGTASSPAESDTATTAARVSSRAAFGAGLASAPGALSGVRLIRAGAARAATPSPSVSPHFALATLVVTGLDRQGATASGGSVSVINTDDALRFVGLSSFFDGTVAFSVPEGNYSLEVNINTPGSNGAPGSESLVVLPQVSVTAPRTVVTADARTATAAVPVPTTPLPSRLEQFATMLDRVSASGAPVNSVLGFIGAAPDLYVTPVSEVTTGALHWSTYYRLDGTAPSASDGLPYLYDVEFPAASGIPDHFPDSVAPSSLATLDAAFHSDLPGHAIDTYRGSYLPWQTFSLRPVSPATAPLRRTEYVTADPDLAWVGAVVWQVDEFNGIDQGPRTVYQAGGRAPDVYLGAPLVPGSNPGTVETLPCTACLQGNTLGLAILPWSDSGGHAVDQLVQSASLTLSTQTRLYADGTLVQQSLLPTGVVTLPAPASAFRLTLDTAKSASWTTTATQTSTTWAWRSNSRAGTLPDRRTCPDGTRICAFEPLLFVDYDLGTDLGNALPAGHPATVSLRLHRQTFDSTPIVATLTLQVSADDGATWTPVPVQAGDAGQFTGTLTAAQVSAAGSGFLSVRVQASDSLATTLDQTIIRAARVSPGA